MNAPLPTSLTSTSLPDTWVERIFDVMLATFGKRFVDQWSGADPDKLKAHWGSKLADLTAAELKRGIDALDSLTFAPTLPEFTRLCKPPLDPLVAYYEAVEGIAARERGEVGNWTHPAIFWATVAIGAHDLKSSTYSHIRHRWEAALQGEIDKGQWVDIPQPALSLPAPSRRDTDRLVAARILAEVKAITPDGKADPKRWAKRIMQRIADGDKTVTPIQASFAKEALGARAD